MKAFFRKSLTVSGGYLKAVLEIELPVDSEGDLIQPLICKRDVLGNRLIPHFGVKILDDNDNVVGREITVARNFELHTSSIPEAVQWLDEQKTQALNTILEVVQNFQLIQAQLPQFEEESIDLFQEDNPF